MSDSIVFAKAKEFALKIIDLYKDLYFRQKEWVLSKQILRSGTSIGANLAEAKRAQSRPDFFAKTFISYKEAEETLYWLELLKYGGFISECRFNEMSGKCEEIIKILTATTKHAPQTSRDRFLRN